MIGLAVLQLRSEPCARIDLCAPLSSLVVDIDHDPPADFTCEYFGRNPWNLVESGNDGQRFELIHG
jgi:hypothetical protein